MKIYILSITLLLATLSLSAQPVQAVPFTPAIEYDTITTNSVGVTEGTLGYSFSTSVPFNVDALAYEVNELGNNHQVGLWDSVGNLLVSTTVLNTDPIQGHFQYHSIAAFSLVPGTYTIGGEQPGGAVPSFAVGFATVPDFTWTHSVTGSAGGGFEFPTLIQTSDPSGQLSLLVVNFSVVSSASAVPEPSTLLLLGSGLVGLMAWRLNKSA